MLLRQPLEHPVRGGVLGADDAGRNRRPDTGECQDHSADVRVEVLEEAGDPLEDRADDVLLRNRIEDLGRRRSEQRLVPSHDIVIRGARSGLGVVHGVSSPRLNCVRSQVAILEVEARRVLPRADVRLDDDCQLDRPCIPGRVATPREG